MRPDLRLIVGGKDDTIHSCTQNQSPQTQTASTLTKPIFKWQKSGLSDQRQIDFKSEPSSLSAIKSSPMDIMACLAAGLKMLVKLVDPTGRSSRSQNFFMPNLTLSQRSRASVTVEPMVALFTPPIPRVQSVPSSPSNAVSSASSTVVNIASRRASTCFEPLASKSISSHQLPTAAEVLAPDLIDFSRIYPKDFFDQNTRPVFHPRTDSVYSSTAGRDATLCDRPRQPSPELKSGRILGSHSHLSLVSTTGRDKPAGNV